MLPVALALVVSAAIAIVALTTLKPAAKGPSQRSGTVTGPHNELHGTPLSASWLANLDATLPDTSASLEQSGGGYTLHMFIPRSTTSDLAAALGVKDIATAGTQAKGVIAEQVAWRIAMAGSYAAAHEPNMLGYSAQAPGAGLDYSQRVERLRKSRGQRFWVANATLDHTPLREGERQLQSNLRVLKSVYGPNVPLSTSITVVRLSTVNYSYALQANIRVAHMSDLQPHLGDLVSGLSTGLVGNDKALIDGLAVVITDSTGQLGGYWHSSRDGSGAHAFPTSIDTSKNMQVDATFPNLTGGPPTMTTGYLGAVTVPPPGTAAQKIMLGAPTTATRNAAEASPTMNTAAAAIAAWQALPVPTGRGGSGHPTAGLFEVTWGQPTHKGVAKNVPFPAWVVWRRGPVTFTGVGTPQKQGTKCTDVGIYDLQIKAWVAEYQTC